MNDKRVMRIANFSWPVLLLLSALVSYITWLASLLTIGGIAGAEFDPWLNGIASVVFSLVLIAASFLIGLHSISSARVIAWIAGSLVTLVWTTLPLLLAILGPASSSTGSGWTGVLWMLPFGAVWAATLAAIGAGRVVRTRRASAI